jgi:hypothetical protein
MKFISFFASVTIVFFSFSAFAANNCAYEKEKTALDSRALQSQLMVAALSCGKQENYNSFVKKFKTELISQKPELEGYFSRQYKSQSASQMNRFMTALANESSKRSLKMDSAEFCKTASGLFDELNKIKPAKLYQVASNKQISSLHGIRSCD